MSLSAQQQVIHFHGHISVAAASASHERYSVSITPKVEEMLKAGCVVAIGVSGGKDSDATVRRLDAYLKEIGHTGPRVLIHSDLGRVEWKDSLPKCQELAKRIGWELIVVKRRAGDLMSRWEKRWQDNVSRYESLECLKLILPWSTPNMRFCTSELKTAIICSELSKRFKGQNILSVTGVRRAESSARAKMPVLSPQPKLTGANSEGYNWNAIIDWPTEDVFSYLDEVGEPLHEAYTKYGSSRVSCVFCIMGAIDDLRAAASCEDNADIYRTMVNLEIRSTFQFQSNRWLGDLAPHLLSLDQREKLQAAKKAAGLRELAESRLTKDMLYTSGWPTRVPTYEEAVIISDVRKEVGAVMGLNVRYTEPEEIRARYAELMQQAEAKRTAKELKKARGKQ